MIFYFTSLLYFGQRQLNFLALHIDQSPQKVEWNDPQYLSIIKLNTIIFPLDYAKKKSSKPLIASSALLYILLSLDDIGFDRFILSFQFIRLSSFIIQNSLQDTITCFKNCKIYNQYIYIKKKKKIPVPTKFIFFIVEVLLFIFCRLLFVVYSYILYINYLVSIKNYIIIYNINKILKDERS